MQTRRSQEPVSRKGREVRVPPGVRHDLRLPPSVLEDEITGWWSPSGKRVGAVILAFESPVFLPLPPVRIGRESRPMDWRAASSTG